MKEMNIAPAGKSKRSKECGVKMAFVTSSDGLLVAAFIIVRIKIGMSKPSRPSSYKRARRRQLVLCVPLF